MLLYYEIDKTKEIEFDHITITIMKSNNNNKKSARSDSSAQLRIHVNKFIASRNNLVEQKDKTIHELELQIQQQKKAIKRKTIKNQGVRRRMLFAQARLRREIEDHKKREKETSEQNNDLLGTLELKEGDILKLRQEKQTLELQIQQQDGAMKSKLSAMKVLEEEYYEAKLRAEEQANGLHEAMASLKAVAEEEARLKREIEEREKETSRQIKDYLGSFLKLRQEKKTLELQIQQQNDAMKSKLSAKEYDTAKLLAKEQLDERTRAKLSALTEKYNKAKELVAGGVCGKIGVRGDIFHQHHLNLMDPLLACVERSLSLNRSLALY